MSDPTAVSRNGVPIRLPDERWQPRIEEHPELVGLRARWRQLQHERVLKGAAGELFAIRTVAPGKAMVVVYREVDDNDEFVITAFLTRRLRSLDQRVQIWPPQD